MEVAKVIERQFPSAGLRVEARPGQGRVLLATRRLERGAVILRAPPTVGVRFERPRPSAPAALRVFEEAERLCESVDDWQDAETIWCVLHSLAPEDAPADWPLPCISPELQRLARLQHAPPRQPHARTRALRRALALKLSATKLEQLISIWDLNSWTHTWDEGYSGLYVVPALMNHSCLPSVNWYNEPGSHDLTLRANRDLDPGDELTVSYIEDDFMHQPPAQRRRHLQATGKQFVCHCSRCMAAQPEERGAVCPRCSRGSVLLGAAAQSCSRCRRPPPAAAVRELQQKERALQAVLRSLDGDGCSPPSGGELAGKAATVMRLLSELKVVGGSRTWRGLGARHWLVHRALRHAAARASVRGRLREAVACLEQRASFVRAAYRGPPTPPCPEHGWELEEQGLLWLQLGKRSAGVRALREAESVLAPMFGPRDPVVLRLRRRLSKRRPAARGAAAPRGPQGKRRRCA